MCGFAYSNPLSMYLARIAGHVSLHIYFSFRMSKFSLVKGLHLAVSVPSVGLNVTYLKLCNNFVQPKGMQAPVVLSFMRSLSTLIQRMLRNCTLCFLFFWELRIWARLLFISTSCFWKEKVASCLWPVHIGGYLHNLLFAVTTLHKCLNTGT